MQEQNPLTSIVVVADNDTGNNTDTTLVDALAPLHWRVNSLVRNSLLLSTKVLLAPRYLLPPGLLSRKGGTLTRMAA
jgi:hypothetical protein